MQTSQKNKISQNKDSERLNIGITIRHLREKKGLKGTELCRLGKELSPKTLTALEKGRIKNPSIVTLQAVAEGLGMTVSDLFRQAEMEKPAYFSLGSQKGLYEIDFAAHGVQLISFTPLAGDFFCGKLILESQKGFDEKLLGYAGAFFAMTLIGQFEGVIEGKKVILKEGDNLFFYGGMKFQISNTLQRNSTLLLVTVPSFLRTSKFLESL